MEKVRDIVVALCVTVCVVGLILWFAKGCEQQHQRDMEHIKRGDLGVGQTWIPAEKVPR